MTENRRGVGLQGKLTITLVLIVSLPIIASAVLIDQIGKVAANFGAQEARARAETIEQVIRVYRDLVVTSKALQGEVAQRIANRPDVLKPVPNVTLDKILESEANLRAIAVLRPDGSAIAEATRPPGPEESGLLRDTVVDYQFPAGGSLRLTFRVIDTEKELQDLKFKLDVAKQFAETRTAIPSGLQTAFLVMMALAAFAAIGVGVLAGRLVTRRVEKLVTTARRVSQGHHDARVELLGKSKDEMAELGSAFNTMLDDLEHARGQVEYLQRIGAWQDVARRLAHEIKNPLTPIQLAVQQTVSSYKGDDARFKKLLGDTREIVEEEIEGLRRLVDTFRTLGQLPKVEKAPIELAELIEELKLDPAFAERVELRAPAEPVTVRADKLLLKRVLANLVENGVHAGAEAGSDGKVIVTWGAERDSVAITVDDHGKGVEDSRRDKIFEPYVTSKATGTGLGLAIARKIAIEHGGDLVLAPGKAPTGGARFIVTLPLRGPEASLA
jgi:two-component system, NtrC family, nitrogen regulation sensor histidine kinase NtrY